MNNHTNPHLPVDSSLAQTTHEGMAVARSAKTVAHCRYHCVRCNEHFTSERAFDEHIDKQFWHRDPRTRPHLMSNGPGVCNLTEAGKTHWGPVWAWYATPDKETSALARKEAA